MTFLTLPWLDCALLLPWLGAACLGVLREPMRAARLGVAAAGATLACAVLAWLAFASPEFAETTSGWTLQLPLFGRVLFRLDTLSAPLLVVTTFQHFLVMVSTPRAKMQRFSFFWALVSEALHLAAFSCQEPWALLGLVLATGLPPLAEFVRQAWSPRAYALHLGLSSGLLVLGWALLEPGRSGPEQSGWAVACLAGGILIRCGAIPFHCWLPELFQHASFGNALLALAPLLGVYLVIRLVLPVASVDVLNCVAVLGSVSGFYAAGMAAVQAEVRRFLAFLFLSLAAQILTGLALRTPASVVGALCLWLAGSLALVGFGLTLRALEARFGALALNRFRGLYEHSPMLAVCFLLTGLASVGFPGTLGFVASELLVYGVLASNFFLGVALVLTITLNGIAVLRAYFLLFTGTRHASAISLAITARERFVLLTLTGLVLLGGLVPQPVMTRLQAITNQVMQRQDNDTP